jgi:catechol 2,3-dioxygenase
MRLGHVSIVASDLERSLAFYTQLAGLRLTERLEYPDDGQGNAPTVARGAFLRCDDTHHRLAIFQLRGDAPANGGLHHVAFELPTPEALLAKLHELRDAGVPIVSHRTGGPGNQPRFYASDPDGHLVEFYWGMDAIGPDGALPEHGPIIEIDLEAFDFAARGAELSRRA